MSSLSFSSSHATPDTSQEEEPPSSGYTPAYGNSAQAELLGLSGRALVEQAKSLAGRLISGDHTDPARAAPLRPEEATAEAKVAAEFAAGQTVATSIWQALDQDSDGQPVIDILEELQANPSLLAATRLAYKEFLNAELMDELTRHLSGEQQLIALRLAKGMGADGASGAAEDAEQPRTYADTDGWVYRQDSDGTITIVAAPEAHHGAAGKRGSGSRRAPPGRRSRRPWVYTRRANRSSKRDKRRRPISPWTRWRARQRRRIWHSPGMHHSSSETRSLLRGARSRVKMPRMGGPMATWTPITERRQRRLCGKPSRMCSQNMKAASCPASPLKEATDPSGIMIS